jgi:hypothetical protein
MATPVHARYALLAALLLAPAVACSFLIGSDAVQCSSTTDCVARGDTFAGTTCSAAHVCIFADAGSDAVVPDAPAEGSVDAGQDGPFDCVGRVYPGEQAGTHVTYTRVFQDVTAASALTQIGIRVCSIIDPNCNSPRTQADGGKIVIPDSNGKVTVDVAFGFDGLLEVTDLVDGGNVVTPALIQVTPPVLEEAGTGPPALMVSPSQFSGTAGVVFPGGGADMSLAHLFFRVHDCHDAPVAGVKVLSDRSGPTTHGFYFDGLIPDPGAVQTDTNGAKGGIINLPPGTIVLTGQFFGTQNKFGSVAVELRAGFVTYVILTPTN